jgi:hypothetical protein
MRVPAGTKEWPDSSQVDAASLSSLTGLGAPPDAYPALKCWAIFGSEPRLQRHSLSCSRCRLIFETDSHISSRRRSMAFFGISVQAFQQALRSLLSFRSLLIARLLKSVLICGYKTHPRFLHQAVRSLTPQSAARFLRNLSMGNFKQSTPRRQKEKDGAFWAPSFSVGKWMF